MKGQELPTKTRPSEQIVAKPQQTELEIGRGRRVANPRSSSRSLPRRATASASTSTTAPGGPRCCSGADGGRLWVAAGSCIRLPAMHLGSDDSGHDDDQLPARQFSSVGRSGPFASAPAAERVPRPTSRSRRSRIARAVDHRLIPMNSPANYASSRCVGDDGCRSTPGRPTPSQGVHLAALARLPSRVHNHQAPEHGSRGVHTGSRPDHTGGLASAGPDRAAKLPSALSCSGASGQRSLALPNQCRTLLRRRVTTAHEREPETKWRAQVAELGLVPVCRVRAAHRCGNDYPAIAPLTADADREWFPFEQAPAGESVVRVYGVTPLR